VRYPIVAVVEGDGERLADGRVEVGGVEGGVLGDDRHAASTGWFARTGLGDAGLGNIGRVDFAARSGGQGERGGD
jgi:hypothetical protein